MRFTDSVALRALPVITFGLTVDAFWRMPCLARSGLARIDPLVSFGTVAEHAHAIHGSSGRFLPLLEAMTKKWRIIRSNIIRSLAATKSGVFEMGCQMLTTI